MFSLKDHIAKKGVFIIAEAGSNHDGDLDTAKKLVREAAASGTDAVKFQAFTRDTLFAEAEYERALKLKKGALLGVDAIAFKDEWYDVLSREAKRAGIHFMVTPFSPEAALRMAKYVPCYKIASCDIQYLPLLRAAAGTKKPVILSTGLASDTDIRRAKGILKKNEMALLHCVVEYPAPAERAALSYIGTLAERYGVIAGYSDHTTDTFTPALAVAHGARIIEKHFTVTPEKKGGDHAMSLSPEKFAAMVSLVRSASAAAGDGEKHLTLQEKKELVFARRGIFAAHDLRKGDSITEKDIVALRPCTGIPAGEWDNVVGKRIKRDMASRSPIMERDIDRG
ncbi:MAG: N-acetylneuraminate synthase family protein [Spirochaetota bacterium]